MNWNSACAIFSVCVEVWFWFSWFFVNSRSPPHFQNFICWCTIRKFGVIANLPKKYWIRYQETIYDTGKMLYGHCLQRMLIRYVFAHRHKSIDNTFSNIIWLIERCMDSIVKILLRYIQNLSIDISICGHVSAQRTRIGWALSVYGKLSSFDECFEKPEC